MQARLREPFVKYVLPKEHQPGTSKEQAVRITRKWFLTPYKKVEKLKASGDPSCVNIQRIRSIMSARRQGEFEAVFFFRGKSRMRFFLGLMVTNAPRTMAVSAFRRASKTIGPVVLGRTSSLRNWMTLGAIA